MYILALAVIWEYYFAWYLFVIVSPKSFDRMSDKTFYQQQISDDSKLRYIYINKEAFPQLRCIAIEAIVFFLLNIIYTIVFFILFAILGNNLIIYYISLGYLFLFMITTFATVIIINLI